MSMLVAVIDAGSLSAAGRNLGVPLPTVSRKISELEVHLGIQLVRRSSRRITLTDAGAAYLDACRRILEQIGEAERAASGEYQTPRGELIVTAPIVFGRLHVLPVICDFLKAYPDIDIRMMLSDRCSFRPPRRPSMPRWPGSHGCYPIRSRAVAEKTLVIILEDFEPPPQPVNLLHAGGKLAPLKLRAFLDFAAPRLKARLRH
jgi:DNA-binding transcriptional LysR family regulator